MDAPESEAEKELKNWNRRVTKQVKRIVESDEPEAIIEDLFPEYDGETANKDNR